MKTTPWVIAVALTLGVSAAEAQAPTRSDDETETTNEIGVFVGGLSNLDADETGPGVGFDYTKEMSETFGIGGLVEWANAGEREAMFAATFEWKPGADLKLIFAPGVVVEKDGGSKKPVFAFRTGLGRMFEVNHVPLTPTLYLDLVDADDGVDVHLVYGLTIEIPF